MSKREKCVYCGKVIVTRSKEHIIQNAIGGLYESEDICCINEKREELMKISKELNGQKKDNLEDSQKFDVIVSDILNILKKGEYAL